MMQMLTTKYRIYPDRETEAKLAEALESCRWLYNRLLEECKKAKDAGKPLRMYDCQNMIPVLKKEYPALNDVYSKVLQMVNITLWANIHGLAGLRKRGRKIGHIRYKGKGWYKTLNYNQSGFRIDGNFLFFSKIGMVRMELHRPVDGKVKGVIIKHCDGKWYAVVQMDCPVKQLPDNGAIVGIDVGLSNFVVDSDGNCFENPRCLGRSLEKIKIAQKTLSRKQKGSHNREKARRRVTRLHEDVNNQRNDFLHKVSRYYVNNYGRIFVEDLDVKGLIEKGSSKGLNRNIHDAAWSRFLGMIGYKAESAGRKVIKVEARGTTQHCSRCGNIVKKTLKERVHDCPFCGFVADRDYNAARNILIAGVGHAVELAEPKPLLRITVEQALTMKQEAPSFRAG
jgi:putative transposase